MIKIRLARRGRTHAPIYKIVATDTRNARDGGFIESLGQYDPHAEPMLSGLKVDRLKNFVSHGAQLSSTVETLLKREKVQLS